MSLTENYIHTLPRSRRKWFTDRYSPDEYLQVVSVDPGKVNFAFRIERRYNNGKIIPLAFWKKKITGNLYVNLTKELEQYADLYYDTHVFLVEKQPPQGRKDVCRIMQHTLSYFMIKTKDYPLLPAVYEMSAKIKSKQLQDDNNDNLKKWASKEARELLKRRGDEWSLGVMDYWKAKGQPKGQKKDDDLADTIVMIEAYCKTKNFPLTTSINNF